MSTCQQVIDTALVRGGLQSIYDADDATVVNVALRELNLMLDMWSSEQAPLFNIVDAFTGAPVPGFVLNPGQALYTIGTGVGPLLGVRPPSIQDVFLRDGNAVDYYQRIIGTDEYVRLIYKVAPGRPDRVYVNYQATTITLTFYPTPAYTDECHILYNEALAQFTTTTQTVVFPPGYEDTFCNNLAVRMCTNFGKPIPPWVASAAAWGKNVIEAASEEYYLLQSPMPTHKRRFFNILTGNTV